MAHNHPSGAWGAAAHAAEVRAPQGAESHEPRVPPRVLPRVLGLWRVDGGGVGRWGREVVKQMVNIDGSPTNHVGN